MTFYHCFPIWQILIGQMEYNTTSHSFYGLKTSDKDDSFFSSKSFEEYKEKCTTDSATATCLYDKF